MPAFPQQLNMTPNPPTSMSLTCSAGTATTDPITGLVTPRIEVQWTTPLDALTTQIQVQYQLENSGMPSGPWIDAGMADVSLNLFYIPAIKSMAGIITSRIRSVRPSGATSVWESIADFIASLTLTVASQLALASGTLIAEAYAPITFTGDTTTSSTSITSVSSTTGLVVGQAVSGAGLPTGATIANIGSGNYHAVSSSHRDGLRYYADASWAGEHLRLIILDRHRQYHSDGQSHLPDSGAESGSTVLGLLHRPDAGWWQHHRDCYADSSGLSQ